MLYSLHLKSLKLSFNVGVLLNHLCEFVSLTAGVFVYKKNTLIFLTLKSTELVSVNLLKKVWLSKTSAPPTVSDNEVLLHLYLY